MTHRLLLLSILEGGILALVAAAFLLLLRGASDHEVARRIEELRKGATVTRPSSLRFWPVLVSWMGRLGTAMRARMLSAKDAEALAKSLATSGLEPSKAMPVFIGAKIACLLGVPALVYLSTVFLGYPTRKQALCVLLSVAVGMTALVGAARSPLNRIRYAQWERDIKKLARKFA